MRRSSRRLRAAHDLNNVLATIAARADAALAAPRLGQAARAEFEEIRRCALEGAAVIRGLLGEAGRAAARPRVQGVALAPLLEAHADDIRRVLGPDRSLVMPALPSVLVQAAPDALARALLDIALNARDATGSGGTLTVSLSAVRLDQPRPAIPEAVPSGPWAVIELADDGAGIAPSVLGRVFEPFFTTKDSTRGSGIGLDSVRTSVRAMGGWATIDSRQGHGTAIRLYLKRIEAPRGTVLLVEDDDAQRRLAARGLRRHGWRVLTAASAEAALARIEAAPPDLLIADVTLPGMDGVALLQALRRRYPDLPGVLVSGYGSVALAGGRETLYLGKPYTAGDLAGIAARAYAGRLGSAENMLRTDG
ncbi:MAG: ATP-binding protein [Acetobacteraceae bacterium]